MSGDVTRDHYARLAATYDENWAYSPGVRRVDDGMPSSGGFVSQVMSLVADIGCGTGLYARQLAQRAACRRMRPIRPQRCWAEVPSDTKLVPDHRERRGPSHRPCSLASMGGYDVTPAQGSSSTTSSDRSSRAHGPLRTCCRPGGSDPGS